MTSVPQRRPAFAALRSRWFAYLWAILFGMLSSVQVVHTHGDPRFHSHHQADATPDDQQGLDGGHCPFCIGAHSTLPVAAVALHPFRIAFAGVLSALSEQTPDRTWHFVLYCRPPPPDRLG